MEVLNKTQNLDIVSLIETNPITKLAQSYQSKLINKIKENFSDEEQQMFVVNFYCYLNYKKNEYVIDLDEIYKWLGFSQKPHAKRHLTKNFIENVDYIV